jgi:hypothetical protein
MILCMEVSHLAGNWVPWKLAESTFPWRMDIEQNCAVREVTVA